MKLSRLAPFLALAPLACASHAAAPPPGAPPAQEEKVVGPPEVSWKDMSKEQRGAYMKKVVQPKMADLFNNEAPEKPKEKFGCKSCHGKGAEDKTFKMPNPDLPKLPNNPAGWEKLKADKPDWLKFMGMKVEPQMAALLGLHPFDPQHPDQPDAFRCDGCHVTEGQ